MSLIFFDGFDHYTDLLTKWTAVQTGTGSAGIGAWGRNSGQGLRFNGQNIDVYTSKVLGGNYATLIVGAAFQTANQNNSPIFVFCDGGTFQTEVRRTSNGNLTVTRNGTVLGTSAKTIATSVWYYIEAKITFHGTTGVAIVKVNGEEWLSLTEVNTKNTANAYANELRLLQGSWCGYNYFDDLCLCDTAGADNNDFLGDVRVVALLPNAAGTYTEWTSSAGQNYTDVDEASPNADTDYVLGGSVGLRDTFGLSDIAATSIVKGINVAITARKDDAGSRSIAPLVRTNGADNEGAGIALSDSYVTYFALHERNPNTGQPWTTAELNDLEAGAKVTA